MKKALLLVALCLSMIAFAAPFAEAIPPEASIAQPITVISPQNTTYDTAVTPFDLPLNISILVPRIAMINWAGYSLNGDLNVTFSGNTTVQVGYGHHTIAVYATDVFGGTYASETLHFTVSIPCDVNGDGIVNIDDVVIVSGAYGATPEDPNWNPSADIAYHYGKIDVFDLVSVVSHYGETAW